MSMTNKTVKEFLNEGFEILFEKSYSFDISGQRYATEEHEHDYKIFYEIWTNSVFDEETSLSVLFSVIKHVLFSKRYGEDEDVTEPERFIKYIAFIYYREKPVVTYFLYHDENYPVSTSYFMRKIEDQENYEKAMFWLKITK